LILRDSLSATARGRSFGGGDQCATGKIRVFTGHDIQHRGAARLGLFPTLFQAGRDPKTRNRSIVDRKPIGMAAIAAIRRLFPFFEAGPVCLIS